MKRRLKLAVVAVSGIVASVIPVLVVTIVPVLVVPLILPCEVANVCYR